MKRKMNRVMVGLAVVSVVIGLWLVVGRAYRFNDVDEVREKMAWLSEHKDEYDVIMLGASGVRSQLAPEVFDRVLSESGRPMKSFNFGVGDMVPPESFYILDRIVAMNPRRLRYIVWCVEPIRVSLSEEGLKTAKGVYWHSTHRSAEVIRLLWQDDMSVPAKVVHTGRHVSAWARSVVQAGRGPSAIESWFGGPRSDGYYGLGFREDGFVSYDDFVAMGSDVVKDIVERFRTQEALYNEELTRYRSGEVNAVFRFSEEHWRYYNSMTTRLQERGIATFVVILPRLLTDTRPLLSLTKCGGVVGGVDLNDPRMYSELFKFENRADRGHLNKVASRLMTEEVARTFVVCLAN